MGMETPRKRGKGSVESHETTHALPFQGRTTKTPSKTDTGRIDRIYQLLTQPMWTKQGRARGPLTLAWIKVRFYLPSFVKTCIGHSVANTIE